MNNSQNKTPLFDAIKEYINKETIPFHVPGHKMGNGIDNEFKIFLGSNTFKIDLTAFEQVDSLHKPEGPIKDAQNLASKLYGSSHTFFSINGTSGAILAMIMSVVKEKEKIILPRNVHKSIISAIILSGALPVFIQPEIDNNLGIANGITASSIYSALKNNPDTKAVLLINPTYYGITSDIQKITQIVHSFNIPVVVDEAHGPHFAFSEKLPVSALDAGCDMCAQSTHKILSSLTQSSMLHIKSRFIDYKKVQQILNILQTTSPSYILLSSLDTCRRQMALHGKELIEYALNLSIYARNEINNIPGLYCFGRDLINKQGIFDIDETKLTICCKELGISGYELYSILAKNYNIQLEMADFYNVIAVCSFGDKRNSFDHLINALWKISKKYYAKEKPIYSIFTIPAIPPQVLTPRKAFFSNKVIHPFKNSAGCISGEFIFSYPPGIPILCPGEIITNEIIDYTLELQNSGLNILGTEDLSCQNIKIIKKE